MSGTRANLIKCKGLETFGSELTNSEGSLRQATNVNVDEKGVITPRRGLNDYGLPTGGSESPVNITKQIFEYKDSIIRHYQSLLEFEDVSGTFQTLNGAYAEVRAGYRIKWQESNSNMYFTTDEGVKKISVKSQSDLNVDMITQAGGIKAGFASGVTVPTVGGFLPPQSKVAYRIVYGTKDNNNNLIIGSPSARFVVTNFSKNVNSEEVSSIDMVDNASVVDGDYFTYTNSTGKYVAYFDKGSAAEPNTSETIGGIFIKVIVTGLSNDKAAAVLANALSVIPNTTIEIDGTVTSKVNLITTEEGDIIGVTVAKDKDNTIDISARVSTDTPTEGDVADGSYANVRVTGVVPEVATTDYFYQIYRTGFIETTTGLTLNDLDPGDEMNLVYESGLIDAEITAGEFEVVDTTPDSFRASAVPLYTNEITGEGILQSNEAPPIALDIELFRGSMFYANTKSTHKLEFSMLSVDDFVSSSTRFIVGNSDISRYYTFVGTTEINEVTVDLVPTAGDYLDVYSANDERRYYIYFGDTIDDPQVAGAIGYRVSLDGTPTVDDIATRIGEALIDNIDFNISVTTDTATFTYTNNGYTTGISNGVGTDISFNITTAGTGESAATDEGGDVLLSGLTSVAQSIDETARSLVKIISKDPLSPVNAYYLSTSEDLPGQILLEARSLEDNTFYIAVEGPFTPPVGEPNATLGQEFSPELPVSLEIEEFTGTNTTTEIKLTGHGYTTGDEVFVGYFKDPTIPADPDSFSGVYTVTVLDVDNFSIPVATPNTFVSFVPVHSSTFTADVESDNQEAPNRLYYSKADKPEAVPIANFINIGPQDEEIKRVLALRDNLFVLKDDGVYIVSGTSAPNFSVRLLDNTRIIAPDSAVVLNNQIYCLTEQGITIITDSGVGVISRGIENLIDKITNQQFDFSSNTFGVAYENDRAYVMFCPEDESDTSSTQAFRYNVFERTWSRWEYEATCGHVMARDSKLYLGNGDRNYVSQERKDDARTDHSDRDFINTINSNGVSGTTIELGTLVDVKSTDVITQTQDVSINYINRRLLVKMDTFDTGITPPGGSTMFDSFSAVQGDNLATVMQALNDYLVTLDGANIAVKAFTLNNLRQLTEDLVVELNTTATVTSLKTYKAPQTVVYESYIKSVDILRNQVTIHADRPFVEGNVNVYKNINKVIEWNPQHFGDPSALKQIRYVTIMFDQNNFYDAVAKFSSDASQAVSEVAFQGKGIGYWGDLPFDEPNAYWGGDGNDIPFRNPVPRGKQKCRYISLTFEHQNAREYFRIIGISGVVRSISDRAYR